MLARQRGILEPPTPPPPHKHTLRVLLIPEQKKKINPGDTSKNSSVIIAQE
jgi:hypothetical protein